MNQMARMPTSPADIAEAFAARCQKQPDLVGMWYTARLRQGIDDRMWFGLYREGQADPAWTGLSHRFGDGIGALTHLLRCQGFAAPPLPRGRAEAVPDWRTLWQTRRPVAAPAAHIEWRQLDVAARRSTPHAPVSLLLDPEQTAAIEATAAMAGVSSTQWLLWTADRATRSTLASRDSVLDWVFPVNLRGTVAQADPLMNHCSGFPVHLAADTAPATLKAQVAARFARHEHWRNWWLLTLGRHVGQAGINLLYRLSAAAPGSHAGSYSNLGDWDVPGLDGLACMAPGSPAYPVAVSTMRCNGRRTLGCRLHPVIGGSSGRAIELLTLWRELATSPDALSGW